MSPRRTALTVFLGAVFLLAAPLAPAADAPRSGRVPTLTRLVKIFYDLENTLADAAHRHDRSALEKLLAEDFELRAAAQPGVPVPRAEWLQAALAAPESEADITQMAAHDYGQVVVFSYQRLRAAGDAQSRQFVVDTWQRRGEGWVLAVRYVAPVAP